MRHPRHDGAAGNLQAACLLLLCVIGKPTDPVHPDAVACLVAEAQAATPPPSFSAGREARMDLVASEEAVPQAPYGRACGSP
jgi:hypothetical protein